MNSMELSPFRELVKNTPPFTEPANFINIFTTARHWFLSSTR